MSRPNVYTCDGNGCSNQSTGVGAGWIEVGICWNMQKGDNATEYHFCPSCSRKISAVLDGPPREECGETFVSGGKEHTCDRRKGHPKGKHASALEPEPKPILKGFT